jgi:hypothetical protein
LPCLSSPRASRLGLAIFLYHFLLPQDVGEPGLETSGTVRVLPGAAVCGPEPRPGATTLETMRQLLLRKRHVASPLRDNDRLPISNSLEETEGASGDAGLNSYMCIRLAERLAVYLSEQLPPAARPVATLSWDQYLAWLCDRVIEGSPNPECHPQIFLLGRRVSGALPGDIREAEEIPT